ncbi:MAG TPA: serine hydrolase domain-containing protein [Chthoniobacterales bacterium]|jgi:CubicO group peptidase (beta-lactamase class C family)
MGFSADELAARIEPLFEENFARFGELGAAISIWHCGAPLLDLEGGWRDAAQNAAWTHDTLVLLWSATKGLGSACLLHVLQEHGLGLERRVAEFWPEFAQSGKGEITLAQLMSHQAGLAAFDRPAEVTDYGGIVRALEEQEPLWEPGTAHGYHARTFGFLIDELVRRIDGRPIREYWRTVFAEPLELDIWIGLPEEKNARTATIYAAKAGETPAPESFYRALNTPGTLQRKVFTSPHGLNAISAMNTPENRARSFASFGGIGSASSLAKFYALLANRGALGSRRFFGEAAIAQMTTTLSAGVDRVFQIPTAFSAGFMKDLPEARSRLFGPSRLAFGHPGAGGSHAFADPENNVAFAYVMNQMEQTLLPNEKSLRLIDAIYA